MVDIIHRIAIKASLSRVHTAISTVEGVAGWWTRETTSSEQGRLVDVLFRNPSGEELGKMRFELLAPSPNREVVWRFAEGPEEWLGTEVIFTLTTQGDYTVVLFGHRRWREPVEFMAHCSTKWATFLLSLKDLLETGRGRPSPADVKIDDWN